MRQYFIFKRICKIVANGFVVSHAKWFDVEIDAEQNGKLIKDITTNLITQIRRSRRAETKLEHEYKLSKLYKTIRVFKKFFLLFFRKLVKMSLVKYLVKSLKETCFDYIAKP